MNETHANLDLQKFKERFSNFFQHKKKVKALENLSSLGDFKHTHYLSLIKRCLTQGFLDEEEDRFLEHMLKKYEIDYLEWSHRTKWLKSKMQDMAEKKRRHPPKQDQQFQFRFPSPNIPVEVLNKEISHNASHLSGRI